MGIFDGFGGGAPPPTYQTNNTNPPHAGNFTTITTTTTGTGISPAVLQQQYNAAQSIGLGQVIQENTTLLRELKEELLPLKKWLIDTYPDIYRQYQAVEALLDLGKGESK